MSTYRFNNNNNDTTITSSTPNGKNQLYSSKLNIKKIHAAPPDSTSSSESSSKNSSSTKINKPKFDLILDRIVDTHKLDLRRIELWLSCYIENHQFEHPKIIIDLIMDNLRSEQYPDARVLQCSFIDLGIPGQKKLVKFMRSLWNLLLDEQDEHISKKHKLVKSSSLTKSAPLAKISKLSNYDCYDHKKIYSGTRDARKSVNTK